MAGCQRCGGGTPRRILRSAVSSGPPAANGAYPLAGYPDCAALHTGEFIGNSIFVVGRLTEHERLFKRSQLGEASDYSKGTADRGNLNIENLPTTALCDEAVLAVYG